MGAENGGKQTIEPDTSLFAFLYGLHEADFLISPAQLVNAQKVLGVLKGADDPVRIKSHLAPLFSFSPDQQQAFSRSFDEWWRTNRTAVETGSGQTEDAHRPIDNNEKEGAQIAPSTAWWRTKNFKISAALFAVLLLGIFGAIYFQPDEPPPPPFVDKYHLSGTVRDVDSRSPISGARLQLGGQSAQTQANGQYSLDYEISTETLLLSAAHPEYEPTDVPINPKETTALDISLKRLPALVLQQRENDQRQLDETVKRTYEWLLIFAALLPFVIFGVWLLWRWWRHRQLEKWRRKHQPDLERLKVAGNERDLYNHPDFLRVTREMRRYRQIAATNLEPARTVEETIRAGNFFTPVYGARRISPEYLILIDRTEYVDQNARLIDEIVDQLKKQGVFVERYFFDLNPQICWREDSNERFYDLSALAARHPEDRLLIFSDGAGLIDPFLKRPRQDVFRLLASWEVRMLLITNAANPFHEWLCRQFGLPVLMAHKSDLKTLLDIINPSEAPKKDARSKASRRRYSKYPALLRSETDKWWLRDTPPEQTMSESERNAGEPVYQSEKVEILLTQFEYYLEPKGYELLCACAIYPELLWDLSFYLSYHLLEAGEREEILENLVCLPWFRTGRMPGWLRTSLLESLPAEREVVIRQLVETLLISYLQNPQRGFQLELARGTPPPSWTTRFGARIRAWRAKKRLYDLIKIESRESPLRDYVFLNFLSGNRLAVILPRKLRQALQSSSKNVGKWSSRLSRFVEQVVSGFFTLLKRHGNLLLGLSRLRTATITVFAAVAGVLILLYSATAALLIARSIPEGITRDLPETVLNVNPPFPLPTVVPSVPPTPAPTPTPTPDISTPLPTPIQSPDANLSNSFDNNANYNKPDLRTPKPTSSPANHNFNINTNIKTPTPIPPGDPKSAVRVRFIDSILSKPITNGRLVVRPVNGTDTVFDQGFNGEVQLDFELPAGDYTFIASVPGYTTDVSRVQIDGTGVSIPIRLQRGTPEPSNTSCFNEVTVNAPGMIQPGEEVTFTADVKTSESALSYNWAVSGGSIVSGQGTSITVGGFSQPGSYTATVNIQADNANCEAKTASATVKVIDPVKSTPTLTDQFGKMPDGEFKARLQNYYIELNIEPSAQGYMINYGTDKEIAARESQLQRGIKLMNLDRSRLTMVRGGANPNGAGVYTKFYVVPAGAENPQP